MELIILVEVANGGAEKDFGCGDMDLVALSGEGALSVDRHHGWGFKRFRQGESSHSFPELFVPNGRVCVRSLDFPGCHSIGE